MITLHHGGASGHSASVLITLAEKGLDYDGHPLDLAAFEQHGAAFLRVNPAGQVPVLEADGRVLTEAFFILLYLDERFREPPLGGAEPRARYTVQKWGKYVETHIAPNLAIAGWAARGVGLNAAAQQGLELLTPERKALWRRADAGIPAEDVEAARAALTKAAVRLAEDLADCPWLAGDHFTLADIIAFPPAARLADLGIDVPTGVAAWLDRVSARPAVCEALGTGGIDRSVATMGPERGRWG